MVKSILKSLLVLSLLGIVCAFTIPANEGYVTDTVGVFSETQKADLNTKIQEIEKATSIEIAILVVPTVDDDINLAAVDVGNQWGVGKKGQNNGLVLLIAVDDRKWSIQVGYGLEGTLPDLATKRIGEARFPSNFREGNYYQGVVEMLDDVLGYIKQDPTILQTYSQDSQQTTSSSSDDNYREIIFIAILFGIVGFGRLITVPSIKEKRKMRKYGRWIYAVSGLVLSIIVSFFLANFVISAIFSYMGLGFGILSALGNKKGGGRGGVRFGGGGGSFGGGSSFGGFGGGGFGGGGSSGSR